MSALGPEVGGIRELEVPRASVSSELARGEILHVDRFGNPVTSLRAEDLPAEWGETLSLRAMGREWRVRLAACFAEGDLGEMLLVRGQRGPDRDLVQQGERGRRLGPRGRRRNNNS
ncbi:MAG: hypothetical protein DRO01_00815 [Thermoproteota archaeon]|nr:MAG: hypothetical protein DRO01_00815 [Candidatus Korarchaeota archaeon]